jgi:hypothetical protein
MSRHVSGSVIILLIVSVIVIAFESHPVLANLPSVDIPVPWTSGTHTMLNITIHHDTTLLPSPDHYIDQVEVDIDGSPNLINLTNSPPQPQFSFVVQYDMGEVTGTPTVQAKAHCTIHLWGNPSTPIQIPEFSLTYVLLVLVILTTTLMFFRLKAYGSKKRCARAQNEVIESGSLKSKCSRPV